MFLCYLHWHSFDINFIYRRYYCQKVAKIIFKFLTHNYIKNWKVLIFLKIEKFQRIYLTFSYIRSRLLLYERYIKYWKKDNSSYSKYLFLTYIFFIGTFNKFLINIYEVNLSLITKITIVVILLNLFYSSNNF